MFKGIRLLAHPTAHQKFILSQWMGCARTIWNAKCSDERYMTRFATRFYPIGTYAPIDQSYSQYKDKELSPWLYECPSQILRNSASNWHKTYWEFIKGECGKPNHKHKSSGGSIHLTRELFKFVHCEDGNTRLFIGSKSNNIGFLSIKRHKDFKIPNSIYIKKHHGRYWVSFCYGEQTQSSHAFNKENLSHLKKADVTWLERHTVGIDRGVARPVQAGRNHYDFTKEQKDKKKGHAKYIKRLARQVSRKEKGSARYKRSKQRLNRRHERVANIRKDFCHQTSRKIIDEPSYKIIVLEDLNTKGMTRSPAPKPNDKGGWDKNQSKAKAGLNKAILDKGWHLFESYIFYKAQNAGKACFKVNAQYTSQTCAACDHTDSSNRKSQSVFICESCDHTDNADSNASMVIKKRAIRLIKDSGAELSKRGVLTRSKDKGRGAEDKSVRTKVPAAVGNDSSKKKRNVAASTVAA